MMRNRILSGRMRSALTSTDVPFYLVAAMLKFS